MRYSTSRVARVRIGRILAVATFVLIVFSSSWICHGLYLGYSGASLGGNTRIIAPAGYEGPVLIVWSVPGGQQFAEVRDGGRLLYYYLPDDGALLIEDDPPLAHLFGLPFLSLGGHLTFWRKLPGGHLQSVPSNSCPDDPSDPEVGLCAGGVGGNKTIVSNEIAREQRPFRSYIITTYENKSASWDALWDLKEEYDNAIHFSPSEIGPQR